MFKKVRIHIEDIAWNLDPKFIFYRVLYILNRRISLPQVIFKENLGDIYEEKNLEKFMISHNQGCFIDVGANVGRWTLFLAKKGYTVHAFEPSPRPYQILKSRIKPRYKIKTYHCALGDFNGSSMLNIHKQSSISTIDNLIKKGEGFTFQIQVPIRTLDSFKLENVGLIKIDTEGYETQILSGASETILKWKPRLLIEVHSPYREEAIKITKILEKLKYCWGIHYKRNLRASNPQPYIIANALNLREARYIEEVGV